MLFTMKKIILAFMTIAALLMGIGVTTATAAKYSPITVTTGWSKSQYFPTDKTVTLKVTHPKMKNVTFSIYGKNTENTKPIAALKTTTLKNKKGKLTGYSFTFPNPKTSNIDYLLHIKTTDATNPTSMVIRVPYMTHPLYISARNTPRGVAENETRSIQARLTNPDPRMHYTVQTKTKGKWVNIKKYKNVKTTRTHNVNAYIKIKFPKKPGKYKYRIIATGAYSKKTAKSNLFTITVMKQKKYATYIKKAKTYAKAYCPKTPVYVANGPFAMGKGTAGIAYPLEMVYAIRLGLSNEDLKMTSLHECAHILQYSIIQYAPETIANKYKKTGTKLFNTTAYRWIEIEATCMSLLMSGTKYRAREPYTKTCTAKQFKQAKKTLKDGKKYYNQYYKTYYNQ